VLTALLPGTLIDLCGDPAHTCRAVTQPAALVFAIVICVVALIDVILRRKKA